jgi:replicative DNA helicase
VDNIAPFSPEIAMLRLFSRDKEVLKKYTDICDKLDVDSEINVVYESIKNYYKRFPEHNFLSREELITTITAEYGLYKSLDVVTDIVNSMYVLDISDSLSKDIVNNLVEKSIANKIINKLLPTISENKFRTLPSIEEDLKEYQSYVDTYVDTSKLFVNTPLKDILTKYKSPDGLRWRLNCLNNALGNIVPGMLIHLAARPEVGKTSLLASEATWIAQQLKPDECIMWFNNEEAADRIRLRIFSAFMEMTDEELLLHADVVSALYEDRIGTKLRLIDNVMTLEQIRQLVKEYRPKLIIIDHADKPYFAGCKSMDLPIRLRELYKYYRELGKLYDMSIIAVGHCNSDAEGKKWVELDHLDYSRTGKGAEIDTLLGIGKTHDENDEGYRFISTPKNKLTGKHVKETVQFNSAKARFYDIA